MKLVTALLILGCLFSAGCRRRKAGVPASAPPVAEAPETVPVQTPSLPPGTPPPSGVSGSHSGEPANAAQVRAAYHQYFAKIGSFPNNWQEMVQRKFLPAVPQGKNGQPLDFVQFTLWEASQPAR